MKPGVYDVDVHITGFRAVRVNSVPVHEASTTEVNVELQVGTSMQTVEVTSTAVKLEADNASLAPVKSPAGTRAQVKEATFTPRLRDYFPETLFWSPSVITDSNGRARVKFKLADNITTRKMTVLASNKSGEVGVGESEFNAFQPFFVEHDPPKVLTVGDVIDLPVVLRSYLTSTQQLSVEMKPSPWFQLLQPGTQQISVAADRSTTALFPFRVTETVQAGKQQVFASNRTVGDAVEKLVTVHPDGQQQASTASSLLRGDSTIAVHVPVSVIPGSLHARVKIYPNLLTHVTESIEAGMERPYGCGEQTISAAYPSLLLLKYYEASGVVSGRMKDKAKQYLGLGYRNLLNYRTAAGGFSYRSNGQPDVALTAYAVRFLTDASALIDVDPNVLRGAEMWLVAQQTKSGDWVPGRGDNHVALTAYVAVTLAQAEQKEDARHNKILQDSLAKGLEFLSSGQQDVSDPYTLAEYAIAARASGAAQKSSVAIGKLEGLAVSERGGVYWTLEQNTPFYGWGHAGRIESTAMVINALSQTSGDSAESRRLIDQGTIWLLSEQDRYGMWYSGQATVDVLIGIAPLHWDNGQRRAQHGYDSVGEWGCCIAKYFRVFLFRQSDLCRHLRCRPCRRQHDCRAK